MLSHGLLFPPLEKYPEGYEATFLTEVREELHCPICMLVAREAVVTEDCGHLFCQGCMALSVKRTPECPVCRLKVDGANAVRRDVRARREIGNLPVACPQRAVGCGWRGTLMQLERHDREACDYAVIPCPSPYCGLVMQRRFLAKHGPTCRGARAPEELRRRMQRSAVKIQAAFRGHRTRVRFKYLMMLQDKEMSLHNRMFRHIISGQCRPRGPLVRPPPRSSLVPQPPSAPAPLPLQSTTVPVQLIRQLQAPRRTSGAPSFSTAPQMSVRPPSPPRPPPAAGQFPALPLPLRRGPPTPSLLDGAPPDGARSGYASRSLLPVVPPPFAHHRGSASTAAEEEEEGASHVSDCGESEIEDAVEPDDDLGRQTLHGAWRPEPVDEALDGTADWPREEDGEFIAEDTLGSRAADFGSVGTPSMSFSAHRDWGPQPALSLRSLGSAQARRHTMAVVDMDASDWQDGDRRGPERHRRSSEPAEEVLEESFCRKSDGAPEPLVLATEFCSPNVRASGHAHISRDRVVPAGARPKARARYN